MGHKAGDNVQVLALAEALGWPHVLGAQQVEVTDGLVQVIKRDGLDDT